MCALPGKSKPPIVKDEYTRDKKTGEQVYKERSPEELKKLEALVKSAAGYDEKRGDKVVPFHFVELKDIFRKHFKSSGSA